MKTTKEEIENEAKKSLFHKICNRYSEGEALVEVLKSYKITPMVFSDWLKDPEWKSEFDRCSEAFLIFQDLNIKTKALKAFEKLVEGFSVQETSTEMIGDKVVKTIVKDKHFAPNVQAVVLALQKLMPNVYSEPSKLLPPPASEEEEQIFILGNGKKIKF